ncbi:MAG: peptidoglycan DD-metalloendopeptidase family protein [Geobacter sp.]|nr:peptidoglycan DD-metalloendopeptidase family protein [Geobacter sp.]
MKPIFCAILFFLNLPHAALADIALPVENGVITSGVGLRVDPFGGGKLVFHRGVDIAVPVGTPVRSVRKGLVVFAGDRRGYGSTVIVEHHNGDRTLYGHNSLVRVQLGDSVESGTVVAFSGNSGRSTGPHVHFEQLPSGRPRYDSAEEKETTIQQVSNNSDQRYFLEQQLDESVHSILRTINRIAAVGQGG